MTKLEKLTAVVRVISPVLYALPGIILACKAPAEKSIEALKSLFTSNPKQIAKN